MSTQTDTRGPLERAYDEALTAYAESDEPRNYELRDEEDEE